MRDFHAVTFAQEIVFGAGSVVQLPEAVDGFGWQRLMLCTSPSLRRDGHVEKIGSMLGKKLVAVYDCVQAHVPDFQLTEVLSVAGHHQVDAIIGMGGGSPIGMAKAASFTLEERKGESAFPLTPASQPLIPVIAIPTTYAGSEMTSVYGVTHTDSQPARKITVRDVRITPKLVIYDPDLTLNLPPQVSASTGINALAHCIEALYSIKKTPVASAAAQKGIEHITRALPHVTDDGTDLSARTEMLMGSHLAGYSLALTSMGLHHGLCHVLGGSANVPHGIANSIILPHAMQLNLDAVTSELAIVGRAMGINAASDSALAQAAVDGVFNFIRGLGLPQRLRDADVPQTMLPELAQLALKSKVIQENPKPITEAAQIEGVLEAAW